MKIDATAPISSVGNTFGTVSEGIALTETANKVFNHCAAITRKKDHFLVKNGHVLGLKGEKYYDNYIKSQLNIGNNPNIATYVKPSAAVTSAFKTKTGILGISITAGENAYKNYQSNASTSKILGDAAVDVGLGAVSLAGGAVTVAFVTSLGAPLIGAAVAGFLISTAAVYIIEGFKAGKNEKNLSETLKDGIQKGVNTVAGWFK
ncbi:MULTISPECIES: hypothetical protein [Bacillus]|uniref:hypothetical protein n=1 Tax=Bacillus TaxID=1386 RepID=UPI00030FF409|nr:MULTISPECIES: hypothetical protein [Bacillus]